MKKDELFTSVWPETFVTENTLATLVADVRLRTNVVPGAVECSALDLQVLDFTAH